MNAYEKWEGTYKKKTHQVLILTFLSFFLKTARNKKKQILLKSKPYLRKRDKQIKPIALLMVIGFIGVSIWVFSNMFNNNSMIPSIELTKTPDIDLMVTQTLQYYNLKKTEVKSNSMQAITRTPTPPLEITSTLIEDVINYPTVTMTPESNWDYTGVLSWYWPPLCGTKSDPESINCDHDLFYTADGTAWLDRALAGDLLLACPDRFTFGTRFLIFGDMWTCVDRGGAIVETGFNEGWLDLLSPVMPYPVNFGTKVMIKVYSPLPQY